MVDQEEHCRIVNEKVAVVFSSYIEARSDVKNGTRISYCNQIS